jgi:GNAT superfamily N-acetyltransferase
MTAPSARPYAGEADYWRIRSFLKEVYLANGRREWSWPVQRLDYWRWHGIANCQCCPPLGQVTTLWEDDGRLVAVVNPEEAGYAHLQVHPTWRTPDREQEMVTLAEKHLSVSTEEGRRRLRVWVRTGDALRSGVLLDRGYQPGSFRERKRRGGLDQVPVAVPPGYIIRALREDELPARSWASWRAFHPDEPDDRYVGWEWYHNIQRMPLYRRDLDVVAEAPDGAIASFCTLWYDDVTRSAYFEPVATVPEHQRIGLGRAVMAEAAGRARHMGATQVCVTGASEAANALYAQVVSREFEEWSPWSREWEPEL